MAEVHTLDDVLERLHWTVRELIDHYGLTHREVRRNVNRSIQDIEPDRDRIRPSPDVPAPLWDHYL